MKIEQCRVAGFGALRDCTFSFHDGLNAVCLPNGAGKSTLAGFIKCMLYGLSDTKKQNIAENERKRFAPLGGGAFGGSMTFSCAAGRFTVERTFGKKASDDGFLLSDATTGKRSARYADPIGEAIFGLDAEAFERVFYLSERELSGKNESVAKRLSSPTERVGLSEGLSGALERVDAERRRLSKRGGGGDIDGAERKIAALSVEIADLKEKANTLTAAREKLDSVNAALTDPSDTAELRAATQAERAKEYAALKAEEAELLAFFRAGVPTSEEIRAAERAFESGKKASPARSFAKKMRAPVFLLLLALGALGVAIGLSKSVLGYLLLLPAILWIFCFFSGKFGKKRKYTLQNKNDALVFLSKYPCDSADPFDEIRKKIYHFEEVRRAVGARENEDYERVNSPPSLAALYRERAALEETLRRAEEAAILLEEKENEKALAEKTLENGKRRLALLQKTREFLLLADEKLAGTYLTAISDSLSRYGATLGANAALSADCDLHLAGMKNGLSLPLEIMSRGERALAKLSLRFALADALGGEEVPFLLLDDPFLAVDDAGIGQALTLLSTLAKGRQIVYLTCSASRMP